MHVTVNDIDLESDKDSIIVEQLVVDKTWQGLDSSSLITFYIKRPHVSTDSLGGFSKILAIAPGSLDKKLIINSTNFLWQLPM